LLYIITKKDAGTHFKVGKTNDLTSRLIELQVGTPDELIVYRHWYSTYNYLIEQIIQEAFKNSKDTCKTEWIHINQMDNVIELSEHLISAVCKYEINTDACILTTQPTTFHKSAVSIENNEFDNSVGVDAVKELTTITNDNRQAEYKICNTCEKSIPVSGYYLKDTGEPRGICRKCHGIAAKSYRSKIKTESPGNKIECINRKNFLPVDLFFKSPTGYFGCCSDCHCKINGFENTKQCNMCLELLPRTKFQADTSRKDGCRESCKVCRNKVLVEKRNLRELCTTCNKLHLNIQEHTKTCNYIEPKCEKCFRVFKCEYFLKTHTCLYCEKCNVLFKNNSSRWNHAKKCS
jgi:hypothetical protein